MSVFKEINKADGSGVTQFFRLSSEKQTVETHDYGDFYNFKGSVTSESDLPTTKLEVGDAYFIEDEEKTVFWDGTQWLKIDAHVLNYNYNDASNKPLINGHILQGDKTAADLELQPSGNYLTEIPSEYITEGELEDYDYATKAYVIEQVNNAEHFHREIVTGLPVVGKDNIIYMVKKEGATGEDIYDEYMWVGTRYEHIGSTATDLTNYYKKGEVDSLLEGKVSTRNGFDLSSNDYTTAEKTKLASLENYNDSAIWGAVNVLHNYDDTELRQDITALETAENTLKKDVVELQDKIEDKIEYIRLVKAGDTWTWMDVKGDIISFTQVRDALGLENTFLIIEDIENDGKMIPARYDIDEEVIHVWYTDISGENYEIYLSAETKRLDGLGIQPHYLPHANTLPESGKPGDMISIGSDRTWYVWEDNSWVIIDKGGSVDLSNYLAKDNTTGYAPTGNYNPATKKYVDDSVAAIHIPTKTSQLTNDSNYVTKTSNDLTYYYTKSNTYTKAEVNALIAGGGSGSTTNYSDLTNKPSINGVELNGNKTTSDLGLFSGVYADLTGTPTIPTKTSDLTNDSNYEVNTNKITYINGSSTDDQYPSAKAVYNAINNKVAKDGETIFGWYATCPEGGNMTELHGFTKSDLNSFQVGDYVEWPSTVMSGAVNGGMIIGNDYSHGYKPEGGRYYIRTIYVGRGSDYSFTYVYDLEGENVYKGTWPDSEGGKACFAGDTLIYTSDGDKAIETLQVGDKVKSANAFLNIIEDKPITKIIKHEANNLVEITTKDDKIITTGDHPFNEKEKGVTPARCLEKGDILDTGDLLGSEVKSVKTLNSVRKVYEIVVEDNHNYYVGKKHILVHNEHLKEN